MRSRIRRQPALPLLASEFGESTLHQQGSGEYDPLFLITKLTVFTVVIYSGAIF